MRTKTNGLIVVFVLSIFLGSAYACTALTVKAKDGSVCVARTMEFALNIKSQLMFVPRNQKLNAELGDGKKGMTWENKYAYLGMSAFEKPLFTQGANEKGLHVAQMYFPDFAGYQDLKPDTRNKSLGELDLAGWLLGNFSTLEEVKKNLQNVRVVSVPMNDPAFPDFKDFVFPFHWMVTDSSGKAIVIEYIKGKLHIYDNPIGVFTNAPGFDWHMTNLNNYVNLAALNEGTHQLGSLKVFPLGSGSGMLGLPGDFTPPSRFVRAAFLSLSARPVDTSDQAVIQAFNLISNINITKGNVREPSKSGTQLEFTWWATVTDLSNGCVYFRTYDNPDIRFVDMKKLNMDGKKILRWSINAPPEYKNITQQSKAYK